MKKKLTILLLILIVAINCLIVVPVSAFAQSEEACENHVHSQADIVSATASDSYQLQYNTWDGVWTNDYLYYNCYAFALGKTNSYNPGMLSGYDYDKIFDHYELVNGERLPILYDVSIVKDYVYEDLQHLGYNCIKVTQYGYSIPISGVNLICLRNGYQTINELQIQNRDYHFMKYQNGEWYHKPGRTAILKYNGIPDPSVPWIAESVGPKNGYIVPAKSSYVYDGDMYFFAFQQNCNIMTRYYNTSTHRIGCVNCYENEVFEPHTMVKEPFGRVCSGCGFLIRNNGEIVTPWNNEDLV